VYDQTQGSGAVTLWITLMVIKNNKHIPVMFMRLKILCSKIFKVCSSKLMVENLKIHYFIIIYKFFGTSHK